jgi:L-malate glycosyltransferase
MKVGLAMPISLSLLNGLLPDCPPLADGLPFEQAALMVPELIARGHEVAIFALDPQRTSPAKYQGAGWELHVGPYRPRARSRAIDLFLSERRELLRAMRTARCDVVHAGWSYEFAWAALSSGAPTVTTFHDWAPTVLGFHRDMYRAIRLAMAIRTIASRTRFTAVSPHIAERLERWTHEAVAVIPNARARSAVSRASSKLSPRSGVVLAVNNGWSARKNVATLLRAFPMVRAARPDARLVLVGYDYEVGGSAYTWARRRGLTADVEFRGPIPHQNVVACMVEAEVLAHPSREEACCMVLLEAMASGLPVVAGAHSGGVPWTLDYGRAGILVDVRDPFELAAAITAILTDDLKRAELVSAGRANVVARFDLGVITDAYALEYEAAARGISTSA